MGFLAKKLSGAEEAQLETNYVGGGSRHLETDIYPMTVDMAYFRTAESGAVAVVLDLLGENGEKHSETLWVLSGNDKGNVEYYIDKDGNKKGLPGFVIANSLSLLTTGKELGDLDAVTKTLKIYSYEESKEVPTDVPVITELLGQKAWFGIVSQTVDKTKKNEATGRYEPTGETRNENVIEKVFRFKDKLTTPEIRAGETEAVFFDQWLERNKGVTRDRSSGAKANDRKVPGFGMKAAASNPGIEKPKKTLFGGN